MITHRHLAFALGIFALVEIGSGVWRFLTTPAGQNGLYFGLITGGIALLGALLAWFGQMLAGRIVGGLGIALTLLWFCYDLYKDLQANIAIGPTEIRKLLVIGVGVAALVVACLPGRTDEAASEANLNR